VIGDGTATLLVGPLGPPDRSDGGTVVDHAGVRWLVSGRVASGPLRLSDANPSGKIQIRVAPDSELAARLGVGAGQAELFDDGTLLAGIAPGDWLALTPGDAAALAEQVAGLAGDDDRALIVDRSDGLALFRLTGEAAPLVLASCCDPVAAGGGLSDGAVLSAPIAGCRCHVVRDDVPSPAGDHRGGPSPSYLVVCDRSLAPVVHAALLAAGAGAGVEPEGFAAYRAQRADV
jgi:sarcosine oxidase gamma subunit